MKEDLMEETEMNPKEEIKEENKENLQKEIQEKEDKLEETKNIENKEETNKGEQKENKEVEKIDETEKKIKEENKAKSEQENSDKQDKKKQKIKENKKNKEKLDNKEKIKETEQKKPKKRNIKKIIISIIIVAIIALLFSTVFALSNINNEKIISGITIEGIEVSGLTKEEAKAKLETIYTEKKEKNIELKYGEFESELNPTLMEVSYDIENAVNEAYSLGRNQNIFVNNYNILGTLVGKREISVNMSLNEETTKQTIEDIGANLPGILIEPSYSI